MPRNNHSPKILPWRHYNMYSVMDYIPCVRLSFKATGEILSLTLTDGQIFSIGDSLYI